MPEVRLVGPNGEQVGIVPISRALDMAVQADLDLVEVAPTARPPVVKIMDYGKFKYENAQKAREARRNQVLTVIKEMKLRPKIDGHDYETKKGHVVRFLKVGDKVKVTIMFRGREQSRPSWVSGCCSGSPPMSADLGFVEAAPEAGRPQHDHGAGPAQGTGQGREVADPGQRSAVRPSGAGRCTDDTGDEFDDLELDDLDDDDESGPTPTDDAADDDGRRRRRLRRLRAVAGRRADLQEGGTAAHPRSRRAGRRPRVRTAGSGPSPRTSPDRPSRARPPAPRAAVRARPTTNPPGPSGTGSTRYHPGAAPRRLPPPPAAGPAAPRPASSVLPPPAAPRASRAADHRCRSRGPARAMWSGRRSRPAERQSHRSSHRDQRNAVSRRQPAGTHPRADGLIDNEERHAQDEDTLRNEEAGQDHRLREADSRADEQAAPAGGQVQQRTRRLSGTADFAKVDVPRVKRMLGR